MPDAARIDVLLTGAAGFIGSHIWSALDAEGLRIRCVTRDVEKARRRWPERDWVQADLSDRDDLRRALSDCRVAYYLVHSMGEKQRDFRAREVALARSFAEAAAKAGLERIVYLGGVAPRGTPSKHLLSRLEVGNALRAGRVPTLELRASMIVGVGSTSWLIVRDLAARLPLMVLPRWMRSLSQPVALDDVVRALLEARHLPLAGSVWYDLPGPEALSGREILEQTAEELGLRRPIMIDVPLVTPWLSAHWVRLVTRADWSVARELVLGLEDDLLARDDEYWRLINHTQRMTFREAARSALTQDRSSGSMSDLERAVETAMLSLAHVGHAGGSLPTAGNDLVPLAADAETIRSVQDVEFPLDVAAFEQWGQVERLQSLLEHYFRIAERSSGGLMRVRRRDGAPIIAMRWPPVSLIVMGVPTVTHQPDHHAISVRILGGLVAARETPAKLAIVLRRLPTGTRLSVELRDYRPAAARIWPLSWIYRLQANLHVRVGRRFLRTVARGCAART